MPGNNANAGTVTSPKRDLSGFDLDSVAAGTTLLFNRGGSWSLAGLRIENPNVTPTAPLVFDAYGSGPAPVLRAANGNLFSFGAFNSTLNDGGYTLRNLKLDGLGTAQWGIFVGDHVRNMTIENVEVTGFAIGIHMQSLSRPGVTNMVLRNSNIHRNVEMGMLAKMHNSVIEGNLFEANNFSGSNRNHAIYLSGGDGNVVRNNRFMRNSAVNGVCNGGNFTVHGEVDGLLLEGNLIEQASSTGGCYGFSITAGYSGPEWFRNVVVRNNTVVNLGLCAVCASSAPGIVVEGNKLINLNPNYQIAVQIPASGGGESPGDDPNGPSIVRNNTICQTTPQAGAGIQVPAGSTVSGNVLQRGSAATTGACAR